MSRFTMKRRARSLAAASGLLLALAGCGDAGATGEDGLPGDDGTPGDEGAKGDNGPEGPEGPRGPRGEAGPAGSEGPRGSQGEPGMDGMDGIDLRTTRALGLLGTYESGVFDEGAAEIMAYHPDTQRLFVINAGQGVVQVLEIDVAGTPIDTGELLDAVGDTDSDSFNAAGVNSVDVGGELVAVAVEADGGEDNGQVAFYDATDLTYLGAVEVGILPDALTFTPDGTKVVVSCEGEQLRDDDDEPVDGESTPGSVAVIDVSGGAPGTATNLDFAAFDAFEAELRNRGVRLSPNVDTADPNDFYPPSNDLEPEYAAVSPDGTTAFVTLQENNAFAVVDLAVPEIIDVLPTGLKSWSNFIAQGSVQNVTIPYEDLPVLSTIQTADGESQIRYSGFSGMALREQDGDEYTFWVHGDRGPQTDKLNGNRPHVTNCPAGNATCDPSDYTAQIFEVVIELDDDELELVSGPTKVLDLTRDGGTTPITGLPNHPDLDVGEVPVDLKEQPLSHVDFASGYDPYGGDLEGIVFDNDGDLWMVDEYRAAIYHFDDDNGQLIARYVPEGTAAAASEADGTFGVENLPEAYLHRRANRGFEAVAFNPDAGVNGKIYAFIQSPMDNPADDPVGTNPRGDRRAIRILELDVDGAEPTAEYLYFLEAPAHTSGGAVDKIGDAVYDPSRDVFYVIERDGATGDPTSKKYVFEVSLEGATDILNTTAPNGLTFEQNSVAQLTAAGICAVHKVKLTNLPSVGYYLDDKAEGLTLIDADGTPTLVVVNDNDYGLGAAPPGDGTLELAAEYKDEVFGFLPLAKIGFDASDRDGRISIRDWPVLGMPMPDAISAYESDGQTYYVTANEGDSRDYDEDRGDDFSLDSRLFTAYDDALAADGFGDLLDDENLGRLQCSVLDGDLDADGDHEQLHCYGARSFSIYDAHGNLVFDSGEALEQLMAYVAPQDFNSDNTENWSFDSRSDAKGPEPEGLTIGEVDGRTFAFIGLERQSAIVIADITNPTHVLAVDYVSNRNFVGDAEAGYAGDLGPEGLVFVPTADSPTGDPLLVVGNEVSGTTSVFRVQI